ncbi:hypothetical protein [Nonomuraea sp. 10N515B]|uniref:hypothetical protein n=1 Tax=Nonomuraea sp. 10N515B TaxID=3457422 RepID=UPI003FCC78F0
MVDKGPNAQTADLVTDPNDLPAPVEVVDAPPAPRSRRGRRYRLGSLPASVLTAVLSGTTSLAAATQFISGYDPACPPDRRRRRPAPFIVNRNQARPRCTATSSAARRQARSTTAPISR